MKPIPHATWAEVYDTVYQKTFGTLYTRLTDATLNKISEIAPAPSSVVDFGAGTGRLAIPLARAGHPVVAVDPCREMLAQLDANADGLAITTIECTMAGFQSNERFDLALAVFTVLSYITDEDGLRQSLTAARQSLKDSGRMLIDIPSPQLFHGFEAGDETFSRRVDIQPDGGNRYRYQELLVVNDVDGSKRVFRDSFPIRRWRTGEVLDTARGVGLQLELDLSVFFVSSGSQYILLRPE